MAVCGGRRAAIRGSGVPWPTTSWLVSARWITRADVRDPSSARSYTAASEACLSGSLAKAASGDDRNAPAVALPSKARREIGPASRASADVVRRMQTRSLQSMAAAARARRATVISKWLQMVALRG